jgi:hypothetical protein
MALARMAGYMHHAAKEAAEIQLHPDNFNRDVIFSQSILEPRY